MALLSIPRCSLHWFVFGRDKNTFLWAAELDLEFLPVCHGCQLKDTYQLRACGRTIIFQTNLRVKRTLRKSKSRVCKSRWSKGESMAAINVEKDGKRAQRDPVWEFCDATRASVCARVHMHTHVTMPVCFILTASANKSEKMTLKVSWQRRKFIESPLFCWRQSHDCINCWAKRRWWRFPWCRVTQRWRSEYCSVFFFVFFKAFGIQATQKMQDKKLVQI